MRRDPVRAALEALGEAARRPLDGDALALIRASLAHRSNHVVARGARAAGEGELAVLAPELIHAFPRFLEDPIRRDPGCAAKTEIARALLALACPAPDVYLRGAAHVQREPAFGPPIDTAAELRATSAMALVASGHPAALTVCVGLLVDPEPTARAGGLRALAASGRPDIALLMRLFVLRGDRDPGVLAEAFAALLQLSPDDAVPFVAERLAAPDVDQARGAAMAFGEVRRPEAVAALRGRLSAEDRPDVRHALLLALATSRDPTAFDVLVEVIARGSAADARVAAEALRLFPHEAALQRRVQTALDGRPPPPGRPRPAARPPGTRTPGAGERARSGC